MRKTFSYFSMAGITLLTVMSCNTHPKTTHQNPLDLSGRDTTKNPTQNFFEYANGAWLKNTKIPPSKTGWGSFYIVRDSALHQMKFILDSCRDLENPKKGSIEQQIGDLYAASMDSAAIEKTGIGPLKADLERISKITDAGGILIEIATEYKQGNGMLFGAYVGPDDKNSNVERMQLYQGGLGLPNKNYYFKEDSASRDIRDKYHQYVAHILSLDSFQGDTAAAAAGIIELENKLAQASKTPVQLRDPEANYHLMTLAEISQKTPNIDWETLTDNLGVKVDTMQVGQPEFFTTLSGLLRATPLKVWKNYLTFHLINSYASWMSAPFAEAHFNFYNKLLNGQQEPEERWKRASSLVNGTLGDALGQLYVKKYFPPAAKKYMENLVDNLQQTYKEHIESSDWLSDSTKVKAVNKLEAFTKKIGYPDKWKDYSSIRISRDSLIGNLRRIGEWQYQYNINKLHKPVDKSEWYMTPPTVNAYYNPSFNEIVFPAGILQPPFYFQDGDDAVNYGGIAAVIGHEMTHGFDDQGSQFDKDGNLENWWSKGDRKRFDSIANRVVKLYDSYVVLDTVHVNGELTEGENMADIGGVAIAYAAFKNTEQGKSDTLIDGLTPDQRFFMSYAQIWRIKNTPKRLLWRINNDPHSPEMYRVNGPLSNLKAFYEAYGVKPGDQMYRQDSVRIKIW